MEAQKKKNPKNAGVKKGTVNNPNGRPKGTPNKRSAELRDLMANFLSGNFNRFIQDMSVIEDPAMRSKVYLDAYKTIVPRPIDEDDKEKDNEFRDKLLVALSLSK